MITKLKDQEFLRTMVMLCRLNFIINIDIKRLVSIALAIVFFFAGSIAQAADWGAEAQDIWLSPSTVYQSDTADISAKFKNLSSSSNGYGGEATFDVCIVVYSPSGSGTKYYWNNSSFGLYQVKTYTKLDYSFDQSGAYTIYAEIYDIDGKESGWDEAHRFDQRVVPTKQCRFGNTALFYFVNT